MCMPESHVWFVCENGVGGEEGKKKTKPCDIVFQQNPHRAQQRCPRCSSTQRLVPHSFATLEGGRLKRFLEAKRAKGMQIWAHDMNALQQAGIALP